MDKISAITVGIGLICKIFTKISNFENISDLDLKYNHVFNNSGDIQMIFK